MNQWALELNYILLITPVRKGRPQQSVAEGKAFPLIILLICLYLEKILEYGLTGKTTLNVLNIADIGINSLVNRAIGNTNAPQVNASCGLLELHLDDSQGASFALGTKVEKLTGKVGHSPWWNKIPYTSITNIMNVGGHFVLGNLNNSIIYNPGYKGSLPYKYYNEVMLYEK